MHEKVKHHTQKEHPANPVPGPHIKVPKVGSIQTKAPLQGPRDGRI